jgi:predicted transcriptional regulator
MTSSKPKVRKAIELIHLFVTILSTAVEPVTSVELQRKLPLSLRSTQRYLKDLTELGYLTRDESVRNEVLYQTTFKAKQMLEVRQGINPLVNIQRLVELSQISNAVLTGEVILGISHPSRKPRPPTGNIEPLTSEEIAYRKRWKAVQMSHESFRKSTAVLSVCMEEIA